MSLNVNDFVIASKKIDGIEKQSVGIITNISDDQISVFFIGKKQTVKTTNKNIAFLDITKTGKPFKVKICNICHKLKNEEDFVNNQTDSKGRKTTRPSCKDCRVDIDGVKIKTTERKRLEAIKPELIFTCPICEKMSIVGVTANLVKDHDHTTGMAREWICDSCNTGLGRFKDDYLLKSNSVWY